MLVINFLKSLITFMSAPQCLVSLMLIVVLGALYWRPRWSKKGGVALFSLLALGIGLSYLDRNFAAVATLPDNVPIVAMIFLVGFFFWYAMHQAYENDRRGAAGGSNPPRGGFPAPILSSALLGSGAATSPVLLPPRPT